MIDFTKIGKVVEDQAKAASERNPGLADEITTVVDSFHVRFSDFGVGEVSDVFELCALVDKRLRLDRLKGPLLEVVSQARKQIQESLIELFFQEKKRETFGEFRLVQDLERRKDLAMCLAELVPQVRAKMPKPVDKNWKFNQQWIQLEANGSGLFERLKAGVTDRCTGVQSWEVLRDMLPRDLREHFDISYTVVRDKELAHIIQEFKPLIEKFGTDAVAQFLISSGRVKMGFSQVVRILSEYLGKHRVPQSNPIGIVGTPDQFLELTEIRLLVFIMYRNRVYKDLIKDGYDGRPIESYVARFETIEKELRKEFDPAKPRQKEIFDDLIAYWKDVLSIAPSGRMVSAIQKKDGTFATFPSLRQRVAMKEMKDGNRVIRKNEETGQDEVVRSGNRKLLGFFMGLGKTGTAFLSKEHVGAKKMLYVCPTMIVDELPNEIRKYYKKDAEGAPSIGRIVANMTDEQKARELEAEIVIVPYSMLRDDVVELLKTQQFDFMTVDEVQWARNPDGTYTDSIYRLATEIPGLYENGHIMLMSGDPTPNGPDDIVPQLRIADRVKYGSLSTLASTVRNNDPLVVRNVLLDFYLLLDEPEDWEEKYVEYVDYELNKEEREIYKAIFENDALDSTQKLNMLSLCIMNPSYFAPGREVKSALFDKAVETLEQYLQEYDAVVVTENMYKYGVTREHEEYRDPSFARRLREYFGDRVDVLVYDGSTTDEERKEIIQKSKRKDRKTIIFSVSGTMREGTNEFEHIHRAVVLEPTFNKADTAQLVKRFARGSNRDVEVTVLQASGTVHQGIREHAEYKYSLTELLKYGGSITENDYALLERLNSTDISESIRVVEGRLFVGTAIMNYLLSRKRTLAMVMGALQNRGVEYIQEVFAQYGRMIAEIYCENWEPSMSGNNARFVVGLIRELEEKGIITGRNFGDIASGPLVLERSFELYDQDGKDRAVQSLDLNQHMLDFGGRMIEPKLTPRVGSMTDMRRFLKDGQLDAANCALAFEFTRLDQSFKNPENVERVKALLEFNRVLREGGVLLLTMTSRVCSPEQFAVFQEQLSKHFGFEVLEDYSGRAEAVDTGDEAPFHNYTLVCKKTGKPNLAGLDLSNLVFTRTSQIVNGKRKTVDQNKVNESKGYIHTNFRINGTELEVSRDIEHIKAQEAYYAEAQEAEAFLKDIYEKNGGSFKDLTEETRVELAARGIMLHNIHIKLEGEPDQQLDPTMPKSGKKKKRKSEAYVTKIAFMLYSKHSEFPKIFMLDFANHETGKK